MMPSFDFFVPPRQPQRAQPILQPAPVAAKLAQQSRPVAAPRATPPPTPPPTVRMQSADEGTPPPARIPLIMPSPEALGLGAKPQSGAFDWAGIHRRLDQLGCCCFQMEQQVGSCKLVCLLPTGQTGQTHRIEVLAADSAEAARLLLQRADDWLAKK